MKDSQCKIFKKIYDKIRKNKLSWESLRERCKNNLPFATWLSSIIALLGLFLAFMSFSNTLEISKKQLQQSEKLYELQNRLNVLIKDAGWYPLKVLSGDVGLRIRLYVTNYGKSPASEAHIIKDTVLRIKTDTLTRFSHFIEDVNRGSEQLDINKEKRIVDEYIPYRQKPFRDISKYILEKKGKVTGDEIINHFSTEYKEKGYEFIGYKDVAHQDSLIIPPGDLDPSPEIGRSISIPSFENELRKQGGDILLFYFAIEYVGPLKVKKYITHYIGCYDSLQHAGINRDGVCLVSYWKSFLNESEILMHEKKNK